MYTQGVLHTYLIREVDVARRVENVEEKAFAPHVWHEKGDRRGFDAQSSLALRQKRVCVPHRKLLLRPSK